MSQIEEEQKFEVAQNATVDELEQALAELGFRLDHIQQQRDVYWDDEYCTITNLKRGLRVRHLSGSLHSVEFKSLFVGADGGFVVEEKTLLDDKGMPDHAQLGSVLAGRLGYNSPMQEYDDIERVLTEYGLKPCIVLNKTRRIYVDAAKNVEAAIDEIANLPLHLEAENTGDYQAYKKAVAALRQSLGTRLKPIKAGYLDLIVSQNKKLLSGQEFADRFAADHGWNVLETERELVDALLAKAK